MKRTKHGVLLDTGFFIKFGSKTDPLHQRCCQYIKHFREMDYAIYLSTIVIAEYCVKDDCNSLPLDLVQILPFRWQHAIRAGNFAKNALEKRKHEKQNNVERKIVINDIKLFAQADNEESINYFITADQKCSKIYELISDQQLHFEIIDINKTTIENVFNYIPGILT